MRESEKAALGGIIAALAIVTMLVTYLSPLLVYTAPPFAGLLLIVIVSEMGYKWAVGTYFVVSILSLFFIADKESAVFFTMFFGYFPILEQLLSEKLKSRIVNIISRYLIFNVSITVSVLICAYVFHIDYSEFETYGKVMLVTFFVLMNVVFTVYGLLLKKVKILYNRLAKPKIIKLFHH